VPPEQCPSCGRFLAEALVEELDGQPRPCPHCGDDLTVEEVVGEEVVGEEVVGEEVVGEELGREELGREEVVGEEAATSGPTGPDPTARGTATSVRPPDLAPDAVRDLPDDVLIGWDLGASASEVASWRADRRPVPLDTIVVAGSAAVGAALGASVDRRRGRGAALGLAGGLGLAAGARQVWRLRD
jgi:hypothetical protein